MKTIKKEKQIPPTAILETERLILRPWSIKDAESLFKYASDPDVGPIAGWPIHKSLAESKAIILTVLSAPQTYALVYKETGEVIGSLGIKFETDEGIELKDGEAEIGYWIGKPFWGRGLVPEGVTKIIEYCRDELKLTGLWCGYYNDNKKSARVQEKCGFKPDHVAENVYVSLLDEHRTLHANYLKL